MGKNPNGPIFIPKDIGFGWKLNFARKESWWILGVFLLIIIGDILISFKIIKL